MKIVAIQTLTYNNINRIEPIKLMFKTFIENYIGDRLDWFIILNGYNKDILDVLESIKIKYSDKINLNIDYNEVNMGVGIALNQLNNLCKEYEYTFLLEDDWVCLPNYMSGHSKEWFLNSVKLLEENIELDQIQYRRYLDDLDDRQYGFSYWIKATNIINQVNNGDDFLILRKREYTNNPSLRRMSSLYNKKILPLYESLDNGIPNEIKGNDQWGLAEIKAMENDVLNSAWLYLGNFVHYEHWSFKGNFNDWKERKFGCGVFEMNGWNTCKYGYLFPGHYFCGLCDKDQDISYLEEHSHIYLEEILALEHRQEDNNIILKKLEKLVINPTIDSKNYINESIYLNDKYCRE